MAEIGAFELIFLSQDAHNINFPMSKQSNLDCLPLISLIYRKLEWRHESSNIAIS